MNPLVITFAMDERSRKIATEALGGAAPIVYLSELAGSERTAALRGAGALLARNVGKELQPAELSMIADARLLQFYSAGVDYIPLRDLPPGLPVAGERRRLRRTDGRARARDGTGGSQAPARRA